MTEANTNQLTELNRTIRDQRKAIGGLNKKITELEKSNRDLQNIADTNRARVDQLTKERESLICTLPSEMADRDQREQKLIEGLCAIRKMCEDAPAYRVEADVYKIANDLLTEIGVTVE